MVYDLVDHFKLKIVLIQPKLAYIMTLSTIKANKQMCFLWVIKAVMQCFPHLFSPKKNAVI